MKKTEKVKPIPALREPSLVEPLGEQAAQRAAQPALKAESPPGQVPRDLTASRAHQGPGLEDDDRPSKCRWR